MSDKWVVNQDYPQGHLVAMTAEEQAQYDADQIASASAESAQQVLDTNAATMREKVDQALANLEAAATNWSSLTVGQKDAALKLTVQVVDRLARLTLQRLDVAP